MEQGKRFQSVLQVAEEIARTAGASGSQSPRTQTHLKRTQDAVPGVASRWKWALGIAAFLVVLALFAVELRHYLRAAPIQFAERDWILVTDFSNQTGEKVFDRVVRDLTVQSLSQSTYVNVVPRLSALETAKRTGLKDVSSIDEKLGRELCLRENYRALLNGDIFKERAGYVIAMRVEVLGKDSFVISDTERIQSPDEVFAGVDRLTARIRRALGESLSRIEKDTKALARVTTFSLEALQRYSVALDLYGAGEYTRCIALASDAVERDPNFAMAHLLLGQAYQQLGDEKKAGTQLEFARAGLDRVGERERHLILAVSYSYQLMNEKAAEEYQHLLDIFPDDVDALKGFASEAFWVGHADQAIEAQRRATALSPGDVDCYDALITLLVRTNRFSDALAVYDQARSHKLTAPNLSFLAALATWGAGDLVRSREMLDALSNEGSSWKIVSRMFVGKLLAFQGRMGESIEVFKTGLALVQTPDLEYWIPNFQYQITRAEVVRGNVATSRIECRNFRKATEKFPFPINLQRAGRLSIQVGDIQSAKYMESLARRREAPHPDAFSQMELHGLKGDLALALGRPSDAIQEQRSALTFRPWYTPYFSLGEACEAVGNWKCAIEAYNRYLDFKGAILRDDASEDWVIAQYSLARAYVESGNAASGEARYQEFLSLFTVADADLPILARERRELEHLRGMQLDKAVKPLLGKSNKQ
jgi:pentatricopeptide repeat protein